MKLSCPRPLFTLVQKGECRGGVREREGLLHVPALPFPTIARKQGQKRWALPFHLHWPVLSANLGARSVVLEWWVLPVSYIPKPSTVYVPHAQWGWESTKKTGGDAPLISVRFPPSAPPPVCAPSLGVRHSPFVNAFSLLLHTSAVAMSLPPPPPLFPSFLWYLGRLHLGIHL